MTEDHERLQRKIYTEVAAEIAVTTDAGDSDALVETFLMRKGIELASTVEHDTHPRKSTPPLVTARFKVTYRVHGGWRSDFVKKIESDAADLGIIINGLLVEVERREIPERCPRKICVPCSIAMSPVKSRIVHPNPPVPDTVKPDQSEPDIVKPKRFSKFRFLGGNLA